MCSELLSELWDWNILSSLTRRPRGFLKEGHLRSAKINTSILSLMSTLCQSDCLSRLAALA
jgi:hypothetical protein